ncbi:MAG: hypothetical protein H6811_07760 [Phycisphaeraceae bacterium]|nr:hypothetical protein [Phycisphaeraceae bacterium]
MEAQRVFGIGLSKTGTHSLNAALEVLGIPSVHFPSPELMLAGRYEDALRGFRGATDISVSAYYRELDQAYPGSRFILTLRDVPGWLASVEDHRKRREHELAKPDCPKAAIRERLYGIRGFDRVTFALAYEHHRREVLDHFASRPADLCVMDMGRGDGWEKLCPFLGVDQPDVAFPHHNARHAA